MDVSLEENPSFGYEPPLRRDESSIKHTSAHAARETRARARAEDLNQEIKQNECRILPVDRPGVNPAGLSGT